jgi:hypothetical protein
MTGVKSFDIPKREIWEAFKRIKANRGSSGVDGQTIEVFEARLSGNLYKLWNRLSSGSYHPLSVRRVDCPSSCNWYKERPDLKEDLAHLVQDIKRRICGIASAGLPSFSV